MNIDNNLRQLLENETKIHLAEIRFLYQKLDRQLGLNGARIPITFGFDTDRLGAYTPGFGQDEEEFHFSLLFIGYCVAKPLSKDDRMDLYKHEYAHYMQYNMDIPDKYNWQPHDSNYVLYYYFNKYLSHPRTRKSTSQLQSYMTSQISHPVPANYHTPCPLILRQSLLCRIGRTTVQYR